MTRDFNESWNRYHNENSEYKDLTNGQLKKVMEFL